MGIIIIAIALHLQDCPNIEEVIHNQQRQDAYIMATSNADGMMSYHIIVDGLFMYSRENLYNAVIDLLCYYYILNIAYPKGLHPVCLFLQHFVLGIRDSCKLPNSVLTLCSKLA